MDDPASYEIRVAEHLDAHWRKWFDGVEMEHALTGETVLRGARLDQSALFGVLGRIRDLGLTLISVQRICQ